MASHSEFLKRQRQNSDLKATIARTAATLIEDGDSIMVEAGITTALVGRYLLGKQNIKVVTNSTLLLPYARVESGGALHLCWWDFPT